MGGSAAARFAGAPGHSVAEICSRLTSETACARAGSVSVLLVEAQLPTLSHDRAVNVYGPRNPASSTCATSWLPVNEVGSGVQLLVPAGAISIDPPATPDSPSLVSTTRAVGSLGFTASTLSVGGASSMCTVTELVPELWLPCGSTALFHAVQATVLTPSPSTGSPPAG